MNKKENDDYLVLFQGAKVSKREANKVGVGVLFGLLGAVVTHFLPLGTGRTVNYVIILFCAAIGYFWIGNWLFKKR